MASKGRNHPPPLFTISCSFISWAHTILGFSAFFGALVLALSLHYKNVVKNGVAGWPHEWWPSVSATIGDWPHERSLLQIFIALMSGPRIALVLLSSLLVSLSSPQSSRCRWLAVTGTLRTLSCGGWVYCTSTDFPFMHDVSMITYLVLTPAWMFISWGSLSLPGGKGKHDASEGSAKHLSERARKRRRNTAIAFFSSIPFMCIFYYRHKVMLIPGAYTTYSFFEWNLIIQDLLFDFWSLYDLSRLELHVVEAEYPALMPSPGGSWWQGGANRAVKDGAWSTTPAEATMTRSAAMPVTLSASARTDVKEVDALLQVDKDEHTSEYSQHSVLRSMLTLGTEVWLSYIWWTTLTALHPSIFFFSVYNLSVGGHEILLISQVFALGLMMTPSLRRSVIEDGTGLVKPHPKPLQIALWFTSLLCVGCWWVSDALTRLILTGMANFATAVVHALDWGTAWQYGDDHLQRQVIVWLTGLLLSSLSKYMNHSNNPLWPFMNSTNGGQHPLGLTLTVLCIIERFSRTFDTPPRTNKAGQRARAPQNRGDQLTAALGMGSLLFALHMFLTDSGTVIAFGWTGHPIKGPTAVSQGWIVLLAMAVGTAIAAHKPGFCSDYATPLVGILTVSNAALLFFWNWASFIGGLGIAVILPLLALPVASAALRNHPIKIMLWSWLVADLLTFFQVLTVAYAFVPGGMPFREKTWVMSAVHLAFFAVAVKPVSRHALAVRRVPRVFRHFINALLAACVLIAIATSSLRTIDTSTIAPYHAHDGSRLFTAGIQTVHFGLDQLFYDSTRRMSDLYKDLQLDVIGLLETDLHRSVFGNRDMTQWLAEELGMYADLGPSPKSHTWGAILLSKFPIVNSTHHLLPSPEGELAPAIHAVLDMYGVHVHVIVSHNGQEETPLDRQLQSEAIAKIASDAYPHPLVFIGYVVSKPHREPYNTLFGKGRFHDVDASDKNRWCQYIGFRSLSRVGYVRVSRYTLTDTELQTAKFIVPTEPLNPDVDDRPQRVNGYLIDGVYRYPRHYVDPTAMVYNRFMYYPHYEPIHYLPAHVGKQ